MEGNEEKVDPRFLPANIVSQGYRKNHRRAVNPMRCLAKLKWKKRGMLAWNHE